MDHAEAAQVAAIVGAAGCAVLLALRGRTAYFAGLAAVAAAEALLAWSLVPADDLRLLVGSPARVVAVVVVAAAIVAAAILLVRFPFVAPVAALAAAPFRVPVELGDQEAFLLVPLYAVIAAAALGLGLRAVRGAAVRELPRWLGWPAAAFVGYAAMSLLWSEDVRAGTIDLLFFLLPFVVLVAAIARSPWWGALPRSLAVVQVGLALVFAAVGVWQLWSEDLFFARDLEVANAYTDYFRTTSIFADSSYYGLQLAIAIVVVLAALWSARLHLAAGVVLVAALWTGLYLTYSQSSMVALVVAALGVSMIAASRRTRWALVAATLVLLVAGAGVVAAEVRGDSAQRVTSGRSGLVEGTWRVFVDHPFVGVGIGGQPKATREAGGKRETSRNVSHTTPLTVAAEGGAIGFALYAVFLVGAAWLLGAAYRAHRPLGLGLVGAFTTLFVHSLLYGGFFQNPLTWGTLAVAAAALATAPRASEALASAPVSAPVTPTPVRGRWQT